MFKQQEENAAHPASFLNKGGIHLNQADLIQKIIDAEHQAQALAEQAAGKYGGIHLIRD